jgi:pSer/pThr/pTyr-binding forkhead associated (FHA) protein
MPLTLTVLQGPAVGTQVALAPDPSPRTVGRSPVADVCVPDEWLAERHFAVYFDGDRAVLRDLGTAHGTYVNGAGITECAIAEGDQIAAGQTFFAVSITAAAAAPAEDDELTAEELAEGMRQGPRDRVRWALRDEPAALYAVVDVASDASLIERINRSGEHFCAFDETADPADPGESAPMLVSLSPDGELLVDLLEIAWGRQSAVFLTSPAAFHDVFAHLVAQVDYGPEGEVRATPFQSPEAIYETLARCDHDEAEDFFGPLTTILAESENPDELLRFQRSESGVAVESIAVGS